MPGNPEFVDMSPCDAFLHMMSPEQLALVLELANERLAAKGKWEMIRWELLQWIGVCMLIASIALGGWWRRLKVHPLIQPACDRYATQPL
jgi:hypothetical protein